jgi:PhnB protein
LERIEVSDLPKGENEVVFGVHGTRFHMLDANEQFGMMAPDVGHPNTIWFNIMVEDIKETYKKTGDAGCTEIQPVTKIPDYGVSNGIFIDRFGSRW